MNLKEYIFFAGEYNRDQFQPRETQKSWRQNYVLQHIKLCQIYFSQHLMIVLFCRSAEHSLPIKKDLENLRIELRLANQKVKESSLFAESLTDEFERYKR